MMIETNNNSFYRSNTHNTISINKNVSNTETIYNAVMDIKKSKLNSFSTLFTLNISNDSIKDKLNYISYKIEDLNNIVNISSKRFDLKSQLSSSSDTAINLKIKNKHEDEYEKILKSFFDNFVYTEEYDKYYYFFNLPLITRSFLLKEENIKNLIHFINITKEEISNFFHSNIVKNVRKWQFNSCNDNSNISRNNYHNKKIINNIEINEKDISDNDNSPIVKPIKKDKCKEKIKKDILVLYVYSINDLIGTIKKIIKSIYIPKTTNIVSSNSELNEKSNIRHLSFKNHKQGIFNIYHNNENYEINENNKSIHFQDVNNYYNNNLSICLNRELKAILIKEILYFKSSSSFSFQNCNKDLISDKIHNKIDDFTINLNLEVNLTNFNEYSIFNDESNLNTNLVTSNLNKNIIILIKFHVSMLHYTNFVYKKFYSFKNENKFIEKLQVNELISRTNKSSSSNLFNSKLQFKGFYYHNNYLSLFFVNKNEFIFKDYDEKIELKNISFKSFDTLSNSFNNCCFFNGQNEITKNINKENKDKNKLSFVNFIGNLFSKYNHNESNIFLETTVQNVLNKDNLKLINKSYNNFYINEMIFKDYNRKNNDHKSDSKLYSFCNKKIKFNSTFKTISLIDDKLFNNFKKNRKMCMNSNVSFFNNHRMNINLDTDMYTNMYTDMSMNMNIDISLKFSHKLNLNDNKMKNQKTNHYFQYSNSINNTRRKFNQNEFFATKMNFFHSLVLNKNDFNLTLNVNEKIMHLSDEYIRMLTTLIKHQLKTNFPNSFLIKNHLLLFFEITFTLDSRLFKTNTYEVTNSSAIKESKVKITNSQKVNIDNKINLSKRSKQLNSESIIDDTIMETVFLNKLEEINKYVEVCSNYYSNIEIVILTDTNGEKDTNKIYNFFLDFISQLEEFYNENADFSRMKSKNNKLKLNLSVNQFPNMSFY